MAADIHLITPEPAEADVVAYLESLLKRARAGDFASIAVAYTKPDNGTGSGWSRTYNLATLSGAVATLQAKIIQRMIP